MAVWKIGRPSNDYSSCKLSVSAVKKSMKEMTEIGILVRIGAKKGGYWEIKE